MSPHDNLMFLETLSGDKPLTRAQKKYARKKMKKKEHKSGEVAFVIEEVLGGIEELKLESEGTANTADVTDSTCVHDGNSNEIEKKIRTLKKKLRQIEELEIRLASEEKLEKEQLIKISKKDKFIDELLILDSND